MPFTLILILAPKSIFLNEDNEVVNPRVLKTATRPRRPSIESVSADGIARNASARRDSGRSVAGVADGINATDGLARNPSVRRDSERSVPGADVPKGIADAVDSSAAEPIPPGASALLSLFDPPAEEAGGDTAAPVEGAAESQAATKLMDMFKDPAEEGSAALAAPDTTGGAATAEAPTEDSPAPQETAPAAALAAEATQEQVPFATEVNIKEYVLKELKALHQSDFIIQAPTITADETGETFQAVCVCEKESVDMVMGRLAHCGVGNIIGSVNVLSLDTSMFSKASCDMLKDEVAPATTVDSADGDGADGSDSEEEDEERRKMFMETASQLRVEQVVIQIKEAATLTFDYLSLLLIASTIAGIGLAVNSTVSIVASMLVSPIMGPVLALTFGSVINNFKLMRLGLITELFSLFVCICVGFVIGLVAIAFGTDGSWPSPEMKSRGLTYGLLVGLAIAVPSGMGVALSVLGDNTSSLVGVAISASLLPPAVNCGMAFAYAAFGFSSDEGAVDDDDGDFTTSAAYVNMGGISLALTIVNIGAIFIAGSIMFRLKDVTPAKHKIAFWQVEGAALKAYRKHNTAQTGIDLHKLHEDDVDILREVGSNKLLRKELLDIYRQTSLTDDEEALPVSKHTIRRKSVDQSAEGGTSVKDMFADMESQLEPTPLKVAAPVKTPSSAGHRRAHSGSRTHRRLPSTPGSPTRRYHNTAPHASPYAGNVPIISSVELQDTRARMRSFGKVVPPPNHQKNA